MAKFKVGDKVRYIKHRSAIDRCNYSIGRVYTVGPLQDTILYTKEVVGGPYLTFDQVELIEAPEKRISAERKIEVKIHETKHLLSYEEACQLHKALEESGV